MKWSMRLSLFHAKSNVRRLTSVVCQASHPPRISPENSSSIASALQFYINSIFPSLGHTIHAHVLKVGLERKTNICIKLLILYVKSGYLSHARRMLDEMPQTTTSSFNSVISGYFRENRTKEALEIVKKMILSGGIPDGFTFSIILKLCADLMKGEWVKQVHAQIVKSKCESDVVLFTALIDSYVKNRYIDYARKVFDKMLERNIICSTAMISGYMNHGSFEKAEEIFDKTMEKDTVIFNAMIDGYSKNNETAKKSLELFIKMLRLNYFPTSSTFVSVIGACTVLSSLEIGQQVHNKVIKYNMIPNIVLDSALIHMYSKCGKMEDAQPVFDRMPEKNVISWTSMIDGYGKNGMPNKALRLFDEMSNNRHKSDKVRPNGVTFLSALSACGHSGLVLEGQKIFKSMEKDYSMKPNMEHYACMVDLLGRAGMLVEALDFVLKMPVKPGSDVWGALLGASRLHDDVEVAEIAANEIFKLTEEKRPGAYVALSNTFASAGKWDGVHKVRELMKVRGVSKDVGCTWVGNENGLHSFHVGKNL